LADQLMSMVKELKELNARKKSGEALSADENKRRKELKAYLKTALAKDKGGTSEGPAVSGLQTSMESSAPKSTPKKKNYDMSIGGVDDLLGAASKSMEGTHQEQIDEFATSAIDDSEAADLGISGEGPSPASLDSLDAIRKKPAAGKKDYSKAFALDAGGLLDAALGSDKVQASVGKLEDPTSKEARARKKGGQSLANMDFAGWLSETSDGKAKQRNDDKTIQAIASKADAAIAENKKHDRVTKPDEVKNQLFDIMGGSGYTPPEAQLAHEQYYGEYVEAGNAYAELDTMMADLKPIDPREIELHRAGLVADENEPAPVPGGLAFLDDFPVLYEMGVLPPATDEVNFDSDDPNLLIPGKRKVTVHLLNGKVLRGAIRTFSKEDMGFRLEPIGTGRAEDLAVQQCKAIFVHMPSKGPSRQVIGRDITVMFKDRRSVKGVSDDYNPAAHMFSLVPPAGRGAQFERIIVNPAAVKAVR
jgi:hypothetical protein